MVNVMFTSLAHWPASGTKVRMTSPTLSVGTCVTSVMVPKPSAYIHAPITEGMAGFVPVAGISSEPIGRSTL